jgi:hypothetical protein
MQVFFRKKDSQWALAPLTALTLLKIFDTLLRYLIKITLTYH